MTKLSVNLNKVALLRNARSNNIPNLHDAARVSLKAGAHGITLHPRPDQRHIRYQDVLELADLLRSEFPQKELNIEGNPFEGKYLELVEKVCPQQCTLVPDTPNQATSDHGWNSFKSIEMLKPVVQRLKKKGCRMSLFVDPNPDWILELSGSGVDCVELYTESYAAAFDQRDKVDKIGAAFAASARAAKKIGLGVNAGHGLNKKNLGFFLDMVPGILEVSIGHALICDAVFLGLEKTVKEYLACI